MGGDTGAPNGANDIPTAKDIPTGNPWPNLKKSAESKSLKFDQDVAYKLANLAAQVIGGLQKLRAVANEVIQREKKF